MANLPTEAGIEPMTHALLPEILVKDQKELDIPKSENSTHNLTLNNENLQ